MKRTISQHRLDSVVCCLVLLPGRDAPQLEELSLKCVLLCLFVAIAVLFAVVFSPQLFTYIF